MKKGGRDLSTHAPQKEGPFLPRFSSLIFKVHNNLAEILNNFLAEGEPDCYEPCTTA
jgi:hypothetical protein